MMASRMEDLENFEFMFTKKAKIETWLQPSKLKKVDEKQQIEDDRKIWIAKTRQAQKAVRKAAADGEGM